MALPTTGITTTLVGNELGVATRNVGNLCRAESINKWSKWKPVRYNKASGLNEAEIQSTNYGLYANELTEIVSNAKIGGNAGTVMAVPLTWGYGKPRGGNNIPSEPFRIGDFRSYNHSAVPAITDVNNVIITNANIDNYINNNADVQWYPSFKFGDQSFETIGSMTPNREIHLYMLEVIQGSQIKDGNWRMGLAIWNPADKFYYIASSPIAITSGLGGSTVNGIFVSLLKESTEVRNLLINMTVGQTLTAIPFLGYKLLKNTSINEFYFLSGSGRAFNFPEANTITITRAGYIYDLYATMVLTQTDNSLGIFSGGITMSSTDEIMGTLNRKSAPPQQIKITFNSSKAVNFNPTLTGSKIQFRKSTSNEWIDITEITINGSSTPVTLSTTSENTLIGSSDLLQSYINSIPPYTGTGYSLGAIRILNNNIVIGEQNIRYIVP